jgi:hypothetical protein
MLKTLRHARLDNSYEAELRKLIAVDLLITRAASSAKLAGGTSPPTT